MRISDWSSDVCSSDLVEVRQAALEEARQHAADRMGIPQQHEAVARLDGAQRRRDLVVVGPPVALAPLGHLGVVRALALTIDLRHVEGLRSEEHTSELQSLMRISYAVFCLKKKNNNTIYV